MRLDDLLGRFAEVVEEGDGWVVTCPAHPDSRPSLRLAVGEKGAVIVKCRARCATPDVLAALGLTFEDLFNVDTAGAVVRRATSRDVPASPARVAALAARLDGYARDARDGELAERVRAYATDRFGVHRSAFDRLGLGVASDLGGGARLVVPFRDRDGVPRGYQARAMEATARVRWMGAKSPEGEAWAKVAWFPGEDEWPEVIVTEGPGDALTACMVGYDVIAVRGAGLAGTVAEAVAAMVGERPVVIVGDADPSGDTFSRTLAAELGRRGVTARKVRPPRDGSDLTEWRADDPRGFAAAFVQALRASHQGGGDIRTRAAAWTDQDLTDVAAAERLCAHFRVFGSGVKYSPEAGFFILDGGVWRHDDLDAVRARAHEVAKSLWDEIRETATMLDRMGGALDPTEAEGLRRKIGKLKSFAKWVNSSRGIEAMVRELKALPVVAIDINSFDQHPHLLACRNGVVNLRTGQLQPHDPALLLTRRVDLDYDPHAVAPRWEAFLSEVFPFARHAELPAYVRRLVGYGISGETAEQCFAVLWGTGANGKSVFTDTLTEVFRELTVTTPFSTFEERGGGGIPNDIAALKGARLVMAAEGEQGKPMAEAVLKRVTGRDLISARFMRKEFFEFRPTFLLLLATNFKPQFRGQDEGLWRRVKLLPWERYFEPEERDHHLGATLLTEAAGIFAWAVRGAVEWYRDGLADPPVIRDATREYRQTSDTLAGFLPGVLVYDPDARRVVGKVLWDAYNQWADDENLPARERWTRRTFFAAIEERGAVKRRTEVGVAFDGVRLARPADHSHDEDPAAPVPVAPPGPSLHDVL